MIGTSEDPRITRSKRAIKRATLDLIVEEGVEAVTIEGITERSGVAKTTIYRHWPDKETLVLEVLESELEAPRDPDTGSLGRDLDILSVGLAHGLADPRVSSMIASLMNASERDPAMSRLHRQFQQSRFEVIKAVVARGRRRGEIRSDITDQEVIDLLGGPLFYRRMVHGVMPDRQYARRVANLVYELVSKKASSRS